MKLNSVFRVTASTATADRLELSGVDGTEGSMNFVRARRRREVPVGSTFTVQLGGRVNLLARVPCSQGIETLGFLFRFRSWFIWTAWDQVSGRSSAPASDLFTLIEQPVASTWAPAATFAAFIP